MTNPPPNFNSPVFFAPVQSVSVSKDINVTSGVNGTATILQVIDTFSTPAPVPEPSSLLLFGTVHAGWSGTAWGRYRRK